MSLVGSSQGTDVASSSALTLIRELRERLRRRGKRSKVRGNGWHGEQEATEKDRLFP